jgi:hypothetical protein
MSEFSDRLNGANGMSRRAALKRTAAVTAGTTALAGLGSRRVVADEVTWFCEGDEVYDSDVGKEVAGMELSGSGPDDSNVNGPLSCGLGFGLSALGESDHDEEWSYYIEKPYFLWSENSTPSDTSVDIVQHYSQESHDESMEKVMEYIRDAMWSLAVPAPNPLDYIDNSPGPDASYHSDRDGFTVTWDTFGNYDYTGNDTAMNGTLFDRTMGASGACEPGTYEFYVTGYADVYRWYCGGKCYADPNPIGSLSPWAYVQIELTDC